MRRVLTPMLAGAWIALLAALHPAQAATPLARGAHVRWIGEAGPTTPVAGWILEIRPDTVIAEGDRDQLEHVLPLAALSSLEIAQPRASRAPRYALVGALAGGAAAVIFVRLVVWVSEEAIHETTGVPVKFEQEKSSDVQIALVGAGVGAALGAVAGSVWRGPETWERVELGGTPVGVIFRTGTERALGLAVRF